MNINQLMKQAQQMQKNLLDAQNKLAETELTGSSGNGMVIIVINGKGDIKSLTIDPKLMIPEEADIVSDLVIAAYNGVLPINSLNDRNTQGEIEKRQSNGKV